MLTVCNVYRCMQVLPGWTRMYTCELSESIHTTLSARCWNWTRSQYIASAIPLRATLKGSFRSWHVAATEGSNARHVSITSFDELESNYKIPCHSCWLSWTCQIGIGTDVVCTCLPTKQSRHTYDCHTCKFLHKRHIQTWLAFALSESKAQDAMAARCVLGDDCSRFLQSGGVWSLLPSCKCQPPATILTPLTRPRFSGACHHIPSMKGPIYSAGYAFLVVVRKAGQPYFWPAWRSLRDAYGIVKHCRM